MSKKDWLLVLLSVAISIFTLVIVFTSIAIVKYDRYQDLRYSQNSSEYVLIISRLVL